MGTQAEGLRHHRQTAKTVCPTGKPMNTNKGTVIRREFVVGLDLGQINDLSAISAMEVATILTGEID